MTADKIAVAVPHAAFFARATPTGNSATSDSCSWRSVATVLGGKETHWTCSIEYLSPRSRAQVWHDKLRRVTNVQIVIRQHLPTGENTQRPSPQFHVQGQKGRSPDGLRPLQCYSEIYRLSKGLSCTFALSAPSQAKKKPRFLGLMRFLPPEQLVYEGPGRRHKTGHEAQRSREEQGCRRFHSCVEPVVHGRHSRHQLRPGEIAVPH